MKTLLAIVNEMASKVCTQARAEGTWPRNIRGGAAGKSKSYPVSGSNS